MSRNKTAIAEGVIHRVPDDLKTSLLSDPDASTMWEIIIPPARNEWICWVEDSKQE